MGNTFIGVIKSTWRSVRKSNRYSGKNYYSEKIQSQYSKLDVYRNIADCSNLEALSTDANIAFFESSKFQKNPKRYLKRKYGTPSHTIKNNHSIGKITILVYRFYLGKHKTKLELHFFEKTLIMYTYRFSHIEDDLSKNQLIDMLNKKYGIPSETNYKEQYIVDSGMKMIFVTDSVDLTVNYINFSSTGFLRKMETTLNRTRQIRKTTNRKMEQLLVQQL